MTERLSELEPAAVVRVPALLSLATAGRLLDCHARTVRRRIDDGSLPAVIEGGRTMIRADDLRRYIDGLDRAGGVRPGRRRRSRSSGGRFDFLRDG